ncbi:hypothetical protein [Rhodococcus zopfii]|nr:hypothetical protein [Rhodococcus zopfii]
MASDEEFELTLAALAGSLQFETGVAKASDNMVALIRIGGQ